MCSRMTSCSRWRDAWKAWEGRVMCRCVGRCTSACFDCDRPAAILAMHLCGRLHCWPELRWNILLFSTAAVDLKAGKRGRNLGGGGRRESGALNPRPKAEEVVLAPFGVLGRGLNRY